MKIVFRGYFTISGQGEPIHRVMYLTPFLLFRRDWTSAPSAGRSTALIFETLGNELLALQIWVVEPATRFVTTTKG